MGFMEKQVWRRWDILGTSWARPLAACCLQQWSTQQFVKPRSSQGNSLSQQMNNPSNTTHTFIVFFLCHCWWYCHCCCCCWLQCHCCSCSHDHHYHHYHHHNSRSLQSTPFRTQGTARKIGGGVGKPTHRTNNIATYWLNWPRCQCSKKSIF